MGSHACRSTFLLPVKGMHFELQSELPRAVEGQHVEDLILRARRQRFSLMVCDAHTSRRRAVGPIPLLPESGSNSLAWLPQLFFFCRYCPCMQGMSLHVTACPCMAHRESPRPLTEPHLHTHILAYLAVHTVVPFKDMCAIAVSVDVVVPFRGVLLRICFTLC